MPPGPLPPPGGPPRPGMMPPPPPPDPLQGPLLQALLGPPIPAPPTMPGGGVPQQEMLEAMKILQVLAMLGVGGPMGGAGTTPHTQAALGAPAPMIG